MEKNISFDIEICLVYNRNDWHLLINNAITNFINELKIQNFLIVPSDQMGDHLRLIIRTETNIAKELANRADNFFKRFFKKKPSPNRTFNKSELFLNFKNNTIHYGAFSCDGLTNTHSYFFSPLSQGVALVFIKIFQSYKESTFDNNIEILIEIFNIFRCLLNLNRSDSIVFFDSLYQEQINRYKMESRNKIMSILEKNFRKNRDFIEDYLVKPLQIITTEPKTWQETWQETIINLKLSQNIGHEDYKSVIKEIVSVVDLNSNALTAYYFISKAFLNLDIR